MKIALILMLKNAVRILIGRKVIVLGLKLAVEQSGNKVAQSVVDIVEACYENDTDKLMQVVENLVRELKAK